MNYFDFHCHLDAPQFDETRHDLLHDMKTRNVGACTIGVDFASSQKATALALSGTHLWASVGQHPLDNRTELFSASAYQRLIDTHQKQIVSIGECGLDYYWPVKNVQDGVMSQDDLHIEKKRQKLLFIQNIQLALANDLPLMLHVRSSAGTTDAHTDALAVLAEYPEARAVFHFYTEGPKLAQAIIDQGYYISLPGVITFADLDDTVRVIPIDRIFAETDSPYAAPKPHRGKTNSPLYVQHVYEKISEIKDLPVEETRMQILTNIESFFGITL